MDALKIYKFKIMAISLLLISLSFSFSHANENYDHLVELIKESKFIEFKNAYESSNIINEQKNELIKIVDEVIETKKKILPYSGPDEKILKDMYKNFFYSNKRDCIISLLSCLIVIPCGLFVIYYTLKNLLANAKYYKNLRSGQHNNQNMTAAQFGGYLKNERDCDTKLIGHMLTGCFLSALMTKMTFKWAQEYKQILENYKRYKDAIKIKHLLEAA